MKKGQKIQRLSYKTLYDSLVHDLKMMNDQIYQYKAVMRLMIETTESVTEKDILAKALKVAENILIPIE